jgi:hypothetical protein
VSNIS